MRSGNVIYLTEATRIPPEVEPEKELVGKGMDPRWNLLAASSPGWLSPLDATLELAKRGAHGVDFRTATWVVDSGLEIQQRCDRIMG